MSITEGITKTRRITVDEARTIDFMGEENRVYATPEVVRDVEYTCRDLLVENLEPGMDTVGVRVELDHIAATPLGMWVDVEVTVSKLDGRMVTLTVECRDELETVARDKHNRFIVDVQKTAARLAQKRARLE